MPSPAPKVVGNIAPDLKPLAVPIEDLKPLPGNPRHGSVEAVRKSYERFGQRKPVVWQRRGRQKVIISGNHQRLAALELGWTHLAAVEFKGTQAEGDAFSLADNRTSDLGTYDDEALVRMLNDVSDADASLLDAISYDREQIDDLGGHRPPPTRTDPDDVPVAPAKVLSKVGDIWLLGKHRLACGDATSPEIMASLMDGASASMVFTDPPYGVSYESSVHGQVANDTKRRDDLAGMLKASFALQEAHAEEHAAWYIWHAMVTREDFLWAMRAVGLDEITTIVWTKLSANLGWSDYRPGYEVCFYAGRAGEKPAFYGDRTNESVWRIAPTGEAGRAMAIGPGVVVSDGEGHEIRVLTTVPKAQRRHVRASPEQPALLVDADDMGSTTWEVSRETDLVHPTQKPVELARRAILNSSRQGEIVVDSFLGSGCTLIAAEVTDRRCYGVELDPRLCDVIALRWQRLTGVLPVRESSGQPVDFTVL